MVIGEQTFLLRVLTLDRYERIRRNKQRIFFIRNTGYIGMTVNFGYPGYFIKLAVIAINVHVLLFRNHDHVAFCFVKLSQIIQKKSCSFQLVLQRLQVAFNQI